MLFYTFEFLFLFLPVVWTGYYALGRVGGLPAFAWLGAASLFFYGYWDASYVPLILTSIAFNYAMGRLICAGVRANRTKTVRRVTAFAVTVNLVGLGYFKYLNFFVSQANASGLAHWNIAQVALPIGISFFTFTQIAFLADAKAGKVRENDFVSYLLFVTYFPHLVAGPVLHHGEMMPQFNKRDNARINTSNLARGLTFFLMGLFKKIVIADSCAPLTTGVFKVVGVTGGMADAWIGVIAYSLQIYYDFSGYSDMAVGLSLMFNVKLPVNFHSPYRARSVIEFWRRWHMTLSRFLRDYLYFPLGGNRKGPVRRHMNLLVTMVLGGFWHGANWTFVIWGTLHGAYLIANHFWRSAVAPYPTLANPGRTVRAIYWASTLLAVMVAWVYFRAESVTEAHDVLRRMVAGRGANTLATAGNLALIGAAAAWVLLAPNTNQVMAYDFGAEAVHAETPSRVKWSPTVKWALLMALATGLTVAVGVAARQKVDFLYFQF